jgi:dipeptidyl aminopeptidase/acylaminoacyl peptidase
MAGVAVLAIDVAARFAPAAGMAQLTHDGRFKCTPVACGARDEVVYAELADPTLYRLMKLNLKDGATGALRPEAKTSEFEPAFSADGKVFAYLKTSGVLRVNLVIQDETGARLGEVPPGDGFSGMRSPAVAPDHSRVVYSFAEEGRQQLFAVRTDGTSRETLVDSAGINNWPAFSPDGRALVFASSRDGDFEIYRMNADGSDIRRLTHSPGQDIRPRFSPDGKRIGFTSHRDGNAEIYVMDSDGSHVRRMTDSPDRDDYPDWLPGGKQLVIVSEHGGRYDLFRIDVDP